MIVLGFDPDTKTTGLGLTDGDRPIYAKLIAVPNRKAAMHTRRMAMVQAIYSQVAEFRDSHPDAQRVELIVIEGQRIRTYERVRPQDIVHLGQIAGAIAGVCRALWPGVAIAMPEPGDWKQSIRKDIFTRRLLKWMHLEHDERGGLRYVGGKVRVPGTPGLNETDSSHVIDALGLARWGAMR